MAPIALYPFRYRDERTGKWVRARYRAARDEIATRYANWEITGKPELRPDEPVKMWGLSISLPMVIAALLLRTHRRRNHRPKIRRRMSRPSRSHPSRRTCSQRSMRARNS